MLHSREINSLQCVERSGRGQVHARQAWEAGIWHVNTHHTDVVLYKLLFVISENAFARVLMHNSSRY
jgi:hypothetical protein